MRPSRRQVQRYIPLSRCHSASTRYYNRCTHTHKHKSKRRPRQVANDEQACWTKACKRYARCRHNTGESKLECLFDAVKAGAKQFRQRGGTDGRAFWQPLKQRLSDTTPESLTWKRLGKHLRERVLALPEQTTGRAARVIEPHHFVRQQVRIPSEKALSARTVMQVALNIGQWQGTHAPALKARLDYDAWRLTDLSRYVCKKDIPTLSATIADKDFNWMMQHMCESSSSTTLSSGR